MDIEKFREFCLSFEGVTEKTPFGKFARRFESILVFYVLDHMFCFIDMDDFTNVNVKSTPEEIQELKTRYASVTDTINRSMKYWVKIEFGGDMSERHILDLVRRSYELVKEQYKKKH